ncbi:MAG: hypothetical protein V1709_08480 [Planctomycetota bacterium]
MKRIYGIIMVLVLMGLVVFSQTTILIANTHTKNWNAKKSEEDNLTSQKESWESRLAQFNARLKGATDQGKVELEAKIEEEKKAIETIEKKLSEINKWKEVYLKDAKTYLDIRAKAFGIIKEWTANTAELQKLGERVVKYCNGINLIADCEIKKEYKMNDENMTNEKNEIVILPQMVQINFWSPFAETIDFDCSAMSLEDAVNKIIPSGVNIVCRFSTEKTDYVSARFKNIPRMTILDSILQSADYTLEITPSVNRSYADKYRFPGTLTNACFDNVFSLNNIESFTDYSNKNKQVWYNELFAPGSEWINYTAPYQYLINNKDKLSEMFYNCAITTIGAGWWGWANPVVFIIKPNPVPEKEKK